MPQETASRLAELKDALLPAWRRLGNNRAGLLAAGVAFYALLSLFPGMVALVAIVGLWMAPQDILQAVGTIETMMPEEAAGILLSELTDIVAAPSGGLQLAALFGFAVALYSASKAVGSLVDGVSEVRDEAPDRGWLSGFMYKIGLTFLLLCIAALTIASILIVPIVIGLAVPTSGAAPWIALLRWPIVAGFILLGIALVYRSAGAKVPNLTKKRPFPTPGAIVAAIVILPASIGFSLYIETFANYNASFGALGGVVTLLVWLWLSAYIVLGGAALDAEIDVPSAGPADQGDEAIGEHSPG
jgi:membrane protein